MTVGSVLDERTTRMARKKTNAEARMMNKTALIVEGDRGVVRDRPLRHLVNRTKGTGRKASKFKTAARGKESGRRTGR
jgi:hypothetical protein